MMHGGNLKLIERNICVFMYYTTRFHNNKTEFYQRGSALHFMICRVYDNYFSKRHKPIGRCCGNATCLQWSITPTLNMCSLELGISLADSRVTSLAGITM